MFAADYNTLFHSEDTSSSTDSAFSTVSTNSAVSTTSTSSSSSNLLIVNPRKRGRGKALTEEEKIQRAEIAVQTKAAKIQAKNLFISLLSILLLLYCTFFCSFYIDFI